MIKINKLHIKGREQIQLHQELEQIFLKKEEASAEVPSHPTTALSQACLPSYHILQPLCCFIILYSPVCSSCLLFSLVY